MAILEKTLGPEDPTVAQIVNNLALSDTAKGNYAAQNTGMARLLTRLESLYAVAMGFVYFEWRKADGHARPTHQST